MTTNRQITRNLRDRNFWNAYFAEKDIGIRNEMLYTYGFPEESKRLLYSEDEFDEDFQMVDEENNELFSDLSWYEHG